MPLFSTRPTTDFSIKATVALTASCALLAALCLSNTFPAHVSAESPSVATPAAAEAYGKLPLRFEANLGQAGGAAKFLARGDGYTLFLSESGALLRLRRRAPAGEGAQEGARAPYATCTLLRVALEGANRSPKVSGIEEMAGRVNYLVGSDPRRWHTGVPVFAKVKYESVYKGVDLVYYGSEGQLEYDFVVAPGARPERVRLNFEGAHSTRVDENGDLLIATDGGDVRQQKPLAYQEAGGVRREVAARYFKDPRGAVRFALGKYDRSLPLVIDPVLIYSSYLGGVSTDEGLSIAVDSSGSAYVAGSTGSADFPGAGSYQSAKGAFNDAFVLKMSPDGKSFTYATYLGGNGDDFANAVAVDSAGNAYVAGMTGSGSFPHTPGAFQESKDGALDAFIAKLNPAGTALVYSTYLGGVGNERVYSMAVDSAGAAYVAGRTDSPTFTHIPVATRAGNPLLKSIDSGSNWVAAASGLTASSVADVAAADASVLYAGTPLGVYKSTDGGTSWQLTGQARASTAPFSVKTVVVDPTNANIVYVGTSGGSGLYKSTDGGTLYDVKNSGLSIPLVNTLAVAPSSPSTLYAGTSFGIYKSTNGGDTWAEVRGGITGSSPNVTKIIIDPSSPQTVYAATTSRGVLKTTNGGANWAASNNGLVTNFSTPQVRTLAIDPSHPSTLYAALAGFPAGVYKTTDGGANWAESDNGLAAAAGGQTFIPTINALLVDPVAPSTVYAGTGGEGVYKTMDAGASWARSSTGLTNKVILALAARAGNPEAVFAGTSVGNDAFACKLNPSGSALEYMRFLGGSENDEAHGVAVALDGSAYVSGVTGSTDFPVSNALQPASAGSADDFLVKLGADGATRFSTYIGGSSSEQAGDVAVGPDGSAYMTGTTFSSDFPLKNALQPARGDDASFAEAFVTKIAPDGQSLVYSTYLGGGGFDQGFGIAVGADGSAYVTGMTGSSNFPTVGPSNARGGQNDAFVTRINPAGSALLFSTYFGGTFNDQGNRVAVDSAGGIYITGGTNSSDLPIMNSARPSFGGNTDGFVAKFGVEADLSVTLSESRDPVMVGNPLSYMLRVTNAGPSPATGVTLIDTLPANLAFVSATTTQGSCGASGQVVTCSLGDIPASGTATVVITVTPTSAGTASNSAHVTANEPDSTPSNNDAAEATKVSASPSINGHIIASAGGAGLQGVTVTLSGSQSATTQTDANGFYQFAELSVGGTYIVAPSKNGVSFEPPARTFNNLGADQTADFAATDCSWTLSPKSLSIGASGGTGAVTVNTLHGCPWTAASNSDWLTITSGASGTDTGAVTFNVAASTSAPRVGRLTVAGQSFPVYQEFNSCGAPAFNVALYNNLSDSPTIIKAADLNGDGSTDLVAITSALTGGGLRGNVMLNDGHGHFTTSQFDLGIGGMQGFALADFNGDGRPDIAMSSYNFNSVRVLFNNGSGGFGQSSAQIPFSTQGESPLTRGIETGDFNRDGKADLAVATPGTNSIQILLGNGAGGFTQTTAVSTGNAGDLIGLADVDSDGAPDIVLSNGNSFGPQISIKRGDGLGGFGALITSTTAVPVSSFSTGDFDGDGRLDIVAPSTVPDTNSTPSNPSFRYVILVLSGDGAGHFTQKSLTDALAGERIFRLVVADFNNDAKPDVASSGFTDSAAYSVAVRLGNGMGGFGTPIVTGTGGNPNFPGIAALAAADFDGDSRADIAGADYTRGAVVLTNNCGRQPFISGNVGLAGVSVTLSGTQSATTQTDGNGNYFFGGLTAGGNYVVTPSKENYRFSPPSAAVNGLAAGGREVDFTATAMTVSLTPIQYLVNENNNSLRVGVVRSGDTSGAATVSYTTVDNPAAVRCDDTTTMPGVAFARCDYATTVGTVTFAAGETTKTFTIPIIDDAHVEGPETFSVRLFNPTGAALGTPSTATVTILDNDSPGQTNPILQTPLFVRMQYLDFLSREPEAGEPWSATLNNCAANDPSCDRISVSANFFRSQEFQLKGLFIFRFYKVAFGRLPLYSEIVSDMSSVTGSTTAELIAKKGIYTTAFAQRQEFKNLYDTMTNQQFVDTLMNRYNLQQITTINPASPDDTGAPRITQTRSDLVSRLTAGTMTRAQVVRAIADSTEVGATEFNPAFVAMQYFGYLRRDPDAGGYNAWLQTINANPSDFRSMVNGFMNSTEYRLRFGQP